MAASLEAWLRTRPEGATPAEVAREFLRLTGPAAVVDSIARRALEETPSARAGADGRWRVVPTSLHAAVALVAVTTGPDPAVDHLLALGAVAIRGSRIGVPVSALIRPGRPLAPEVLLAAGVRPGAMAGARDAGEVLAALAPDLEGADLVVFDSERPARFVRALLPAATPGADLRTAPALRRAGTIPAGADLAGATEALGLTVPEGDDPGDRARAVAEILLAARELAIDLSPPAPRPGFDFSGVGFGPELLDKLPEAPGIYRFLDREDRLLYVGKARNLRARVASYFGYRGRRRRRHAELMDRLWRVEWEETGSELAALLAEVNEIREREPPVNVQRRVARRRPEAGDLVLFLAGREAGRVEILLLRAGRPAGRIEVDPRRPPIRKLRRALRDAYLAESPPDENPADAQIVASWLRARADEQNLLDLSETGGLEDALARLRECLADPELLTGKFYRR